MIRNKTLTRTTSWLSSFVGFVGYGFGGIAFVSAVVPLTLFVAPFPRARKALLQAILRYFCFFLTRIYLPVLGVYRIGKISGFSTTNTASPTVYIANHRGRLDALLLLGIVKQAGIIMKEKYARMPVYSSLVKHLDFVPVNPRSLESLGNAVEECQSLIKKGRSIIVFPEGTRATSGKLLPFKDIGFRIALAMNVPVVPVLITSDLPFMAKIKGSHFPVRRFTYEVHCLPAVEPEPKERPSVYADRVREIMARELKILDKGTAWEIKSAKDIQHGK